MCTPLSWRLVCIVFAAALNGCGGEGLTLPGGDGAPAALTAVSGYDQEGTVGSRLSRPLVVRVTDSGSRPIAGVAIEFGFQSDIPGAEIDPTEALTNADGRASAQVWLGENTGPQTVLAQVAQASASTLRATFVLTAVADGRHPDDDDDDDD